MTGDTEQNEQLPIGFQTMSPAMADMRAYPAYLFRQVAGHFKDRVWEIGVGHGTYTAWLLNEGKTVLATDIDQNCIEGLRQRFSSNQNISFARVDLTDDSTIIAQNRFQANSILCLNVLEHIDDDTQALKSLRANVAHDCVIGLIVPAHPRLFGRMDHEAGHFRRYTRSSLNTAFESAGWRVERTCYLNLLGAAGWWYHNRWRQDAGLADASVNQQMRSVDRWLPRIARVTDPFTRWFAGLSVMAIAHAN